MGKRIDVPVAYQGGKTRLAKTIVDEFFRLDGPFYDLCCGSGAISIEMVNRGFSPDDIVMVDAGPWGIFWKAIGDGTFSLDWLRYYLDQIPSDLRQVRDFMRDLSLCPASENTAEVFIVLQAASFGGKALWIEGDQWKNNTFRSYWTPTATSSRRSPVNPMMPMPETLLRRVEALVERMHGVHARCDDATVTTPPAGSIAYIDPPYEGTTAYGHTIDAETLFFRIGETSTCYLSEGHPVGRNAKQLSAGRAKGGISGERKVRANEEWLSWLP